MTWVINGEIHPLEVRGESESTKMLLIGLAREMCDVTLNFFIGIAVSLTSSTYWVGNIIVAQVTPILLASSLQTHGTFYLFAGVHLAATLFALLTLPETKVNAIVHV